jgi:hypothetical protein
LLKLLKLQFLLKYQLKHFVKIVVAWRMEGSACGVCSGCGAAFLSCRGLCKRAKSVSFRRFHVLLYSVLHMNDILNT